MFPTSRISTQIHHGRDQNFAGANLVDETEWKAMSATPPRARRQRMPCTWVGQNPRNGSIDLIQEGSSQPVFLLLVMQRRLFQLRKRRRCKSVVRHFLRDERSS